MKTVTSNLSLEAFVFNAHDSLVLIPGRYFWYMLLMAELNVEMMTTHLIFSATKTHRFLYVKI